METSKSDPEIPTYPCPDSDIIKTSCRKPTELCLQAAFNITLEAKPIIGDNNVIFGSNDIRKRVENTAQWPYSVHGIVAFYFKNTRSFGTGTLIGPNIVLTAGHNLYSHEEKAYFNCQKMQFLPGINGQMLPFSYVEVEESFVSPNYVAKKTEDYGILILKEPIGYTTGYFGLACLKYEELLGKTVNIFGYPTDKVESNPNTFEMWGGEGKVGYINEEKSFIDYIIPTSPGQSGASVWYKEGENFYVIGVHVLGGIFGNRATLITRTIYEQIYAFLQKSKSKKHFKLADKKKPSFFEIQVDQKFVIPSEDK